MVARSALARWLIACLLLHAPIVATHSVAMAAGLDICTADSARRNADGSSDAAGVVEGKHHDCCTTCLPIVPARVGPEATPATVHAVAAQPVRASPSAEWLAPLSRGPPLIIR